MCPNCFPQESWLNAGYILAFTICILFFVVAIGAMYAASRTGYLENLDDAKYRMLDD